MPRFFEHQNITQMEADAADVCGPSCERCTLGRLVTKQHRIFPRIGHNIHHRLLALTPRSLSGPRPLSLLILQLESMLESSLPGSHRAPSRLSLQ